MPHFERRISHFFKKCASEIILNTTSIRKPIEKEKCSIESLFGEFVISVGAFIHNQGCHLCLESEEHAWTNGYSAKIFLFIPILKEKNIAHIRRHLLNNNIPTAYEGNDGKHIIFILCSTSSEKLLRPRKFPTGQTI
ncbi:MAG: hypothetical protein HZA34_03305 [Candidatus Pacebacteria bacterium]|nr:hypothetical protein [Candidatus Paceibacterota bacterium]